MFSLLDHRVDQITNKVLYSPAQIPTGHQISAQYPISGSITTLAPPSFLGRPGPSILTGGRSERSLVVDNYARRWTDIDLRSMSFGQYHATTPER